MQNLQPFYNFLFSLQHILPGFGLGVSFKTILRTRPKQEHSGRDCSHYAACPKGEVLKWLEQLAHSIAAKSTLNFCVKFCNEVGAMRNLLSTLQYILPSVSAWDSFTTILNYKTREGYPPGSTFGRWLSLLPGA